MSLSNVVVCVISGPSQCISRLQSTKASRPHLGAVREAQRGFHLGILPGNPLPACTIPCPRTVIPELPAPHHRPSAQEEGCTWSLWPVHAASSVTWSRLGLEAPLPCGPVQIGGLEKRVGLFLIETVTSFRPECLGQGSVFVVTQLLCQV